MIMEVSYHDNAAHYHGHHNSSMYTRNSPSYKLLPIALVAYSKSFTLKILIVINL